MRVLIFGVGVYYERCKNYFKNIDVVGLLDNDANKIGTIKDGVEIFSPKEGVKKTYDKVFVLTPNYISEIKNQLLELGVPENKIVTLYDIREYLGYNDEMNLITIYSNNSQYVSLFSREKFNIAIMTNSLGINGGDMTVLYVANVLKRKYNVHVITKMDGPLRQEFVKINVPVIVDESIMIRSFDQIPWVGSYDMIFANGLMFYNLFDTHEAVFDINAIWWIHSSGSMNDHIPVNKLNNVQQGNVSVYGVSNRAIDSFKKMLPSWSIGHLCYGLDSKYVCDSVKPLDKIIFAIVGSISTRKAQNLFIDAIKNLPPQKRERCEFWIIGSATGKTFADKILREVDALPCVRYLGCIDNESLVKNIYPQISVLVCPSLEDTMPIVCVEAMMFSHPCIVSDNTGTMEYINPYVNGLVVKTGDANDLSNKIEWMVDNSFKIEAMGREAKKVYEKFFSIEQFENKLSNIVEGKLKKKDKNSL